MSCKDVARDVVMFRGQRINPNRPFNICDAREKGRPSSANSSPTDAIAKPPTLVYSQIRSTRSSAGSERCPPKAEVTGSNPVGCTNLFKVVSGFSEARNSGPNCAVAQHGQNRAAFCACKHGESRRSENEEPRRAGERDRGFERDIGRYQAQTYARPSFDTSRNSTLRTVARAVPHG